MEFYNARFELEGDIDLATVPLDGLRVDLEFNPDLGYSESRKGALMHLAGHGNEAALEELEQEHFYDQYGLRELLGLSTEGMVQDPARVFAQFTRPEHQAYVHRTESRGRTRHGRGAQKGPTRAFASDTIDKVDQQIWEYLYRPSTDEEAINERAAVTEELAQSNTTRNAIETTATDINNIERAVVKVFYPADRKNDYRPKKETLLEELVDKGLTAEMLAADSGEIADDLKLDSHQNDGVECLQKLISAPERLRASSDATSGITADAFQKASKATNEYADVLDSIPVEDLLDEARQRGHTHQKKIRNVLAATTNMSVHQLAHVRFAERVATEGMAKIEVCEPGSSQVVNGWNLAYKKGSADGSAKQVQNDSVPDKPLTLHVGSNMGGKSFGLDRALLYRISGQSFGYVAADSAKLDPKHTLLVIDRAASNTANNLSALGVENKVLSEQLPHLTEGSLGVLDETFSTTGDIDAYALYMATIEHTLEQGAQILAANHNERVIRDVGKMAAAQIVHNAVELGGNGSIRHLYKLAEGEDESHTYAVAEKLGLTDRLLLPTASYLAGQQHEVEGIDLYKNTTVDKYTEAEREALKLEARSFNGVFGRYGSVEMIHHEYGNNNVWFQDVGAAIDYGTPLHVYKNSLDSVVTGLMSNKRVHPIVQLAYQTPITSDTKVLYERQRMFVELGNPEINEQLVDAVEQADDLLYAWGLVSEYGNSFDTLLASVFDEIKTYTKRSYSGEEASGPLTHTMINGLIDLGVIEASDELAEALQKLTALEQIAFDEEQHHAAFCEYIDAVDERPGKRTDEEQAEISRLHKAIRKGVKKQAAQIMPDHGFKNKFHKQEIHYYIRKQAKRTLKLVDKKAVKKAKFEDLDTDRLYQLMSDVHGHLAHEAIRKDKIAYYGSPIIDYEFKTSEHAHLIVKLAQDTEGLKPFYDALRQIDSVYVQQYLNYLEPLLDAYTEGIPNGAEYSKKLLDRESSRFYHPTAGRRGAFYVRQSAFGDMYRLVKQAGEMHRFGLRPTTFNNEGILDLEDAFHPATQISGYPKYEELKKQHEAMRSESKRWRNPKEEPHVEERNSYYIRGNEHTRLHTGTNMSGKTYGMQAVTLAQQFAQTIGMVPAARGNVPLYHSIIYTDRVSTDSARNLSAMGNETTKWKEADELVQQAKQAGQPVMVSIDEGWSTASASYQNAFTYGSVAWAKANGVRLHMATHAHEAIEKAQSDFPEIGVVHFATHVDDGGELQFDYKLRPGHEASKAIEVARKLGGLPLSLLDRAEELRNAELAAILTAKSQT